MDVPHRCLSSRISRIAAAMLVAGALSCVPPTSPSSGQTRAEQARDPTAGEATPREAARRPARAPAAPSFTLFETGQVRPLALSPDRQHLFAVNTPDNRLEVFLIHKHE